MDDASLILDPETSRKKQETGIVRILEREARIGAVCRAGLVRLVGEKRAEEVIRWAARVKPYVPNLEDYLLAWARVHLRKAAEAWAARDDDEEWENRVLASIVRARAAADVRWLFRVSGRASDYRRDQDRNLFNRQPVPPPRGRATISIGSKGRR
jgi:hypothetical protein